MHDWLRAAAARRPEHCAVEADDGTLDYAALDAAADRVAAGLAALGVGRGDRIATGLEPSTEFAALLHGAPRAGAALVPLDPSRADEHGAMAAAADARLLPRDLPDGEAAEIAGLDPSPTAAHTVILTSGTSGQPRPVALTSANHDASAQASAAVLGSDPADRWLCPLPLFHVGGLAILIRCARAATTAVLHERFDVQRVRRALESAGQTQVSLVPTMLARLRDAGLSAAPGLRVLLLGGGPVTPSLLEWAVAHGLPARCTYGMTETCSQVVVTEPGRRAGPPLQSAEIAISEQGEILVRGPMVAAGAIGPDGWLHTGDSGELDAAGDLHVRGRIKELIVTGGENVAPAAVEAALLAHPAIADAGVVGMPDERWGERVNAVIVERATVGDAELIEHCRARLPRHAVPKAVTRTSALPRNPAGKLLRDELATLAGRSG